MTRRRRRTRRIRPWRRLALLIAAVPGLYLLAALIGSLVPVNRGWDEPAEGVTVLIADNGVHADLLLPAVAQGLDWRPLLPKSDFAAAAADAQWVAFGAGEERVYLETPRWRDIEARTMWSALAGGKRVMHVEWVADPSYAVREVRLRPAEYRRLWAAIRSDFGGPPRRLDHPGYGPRDAFYRATGKANAVRTCNEWAASKLRIAGIRTSLWPPFVQGLTWRYRPYDQST
ncbi:TIGR02117 family protein [Sphingomonas sp.]|uniref:TIGR02117 family protein n=1 Tax=Sphingomonas sp. TaxID=28214 RepID=UPI00286DB175|nr:TIGR02117 family protein [Sphingomonas sp.]